MGQSCPREFESRIFRQDKFVINFLLEAQLEERHATNVDAGSSNLSEEANMMGSRQAGKAPGFGPGIRRFEPCLPNHFMRV